MFRINYDSTDWVINNCQSKYNITPPRADELRKTYKWTRNDLQESTRILWTGGEYDPNMAHAASIPGFNSPRISGDINVSRYMHISQMAHCEDAHAPADTDKETVKDAMKKTVETLRAWREQ